MSHNPFSKFPSPNAGPDPRTIKISEFQKYQSLEMKKIYARLTVMKRSLPWVACMGGFFLLLALGAEKQVKHNLFGFDYQGGQYLNLKSRYDEDHYAYNRQFQRMHVLGEAMIGDQSVHSKQLIVDLGGQIPQKGSPHIRKQAPHEKFY